MGSSSRIIPDIRGLASQGYQVLCQFNGCCGPAGEREGGEKLGDNGGAGGGGDYVGGVGRGGVGCDGTGRGGVKMGRVRGSGRQWHRGGG